MRKAVRGAGAYSAERAGRFEQNDQGFVFCVRVFHAVTRMTLISLAQNHLKKIKSEKEPLYVKYSKLIGEIIDLLGTEFPSTLSLQEQGKFMIGYYQQRQDLFRKKDKQEDTDNDQ